MDRAWRTVLGLLVVVAAPLIAVWSSLLKERPGLALLLALAWLAVVVACWLFWKVAAESVNRYLGVWATSFNKIASRGIVIVVAQVSRACLTDRPGF